MAMTRNALKAMGLNEEQIGSIIEMHTETVDGLKKQISIYKADAEKLPAVQKELDDLKKDGGGWQKKYEDEHTAFEAYKNDQTAKESKAAKDAAYRELLKNAGVAEKRIDAIMKITDLSGVELGEDGKIKDAEERTKTVKTEFAEFIQTKTERGAYVPDPPAGGSGDGADLGTLSMAEYIAARKKM